MPVNRMFVMACAGLWCVALAAPSSWAGVQSSGGDISVIAAPNSVVLHELESNAELYVFEEGTLTLGSDLDVDITAPGTYTADPNFDVNIDAGTTLTSYFYHFDTSGSSLSVGRSGSITFDAPILGLIVLGESLDDTDDLLGNPATAYPGAGNEPLRGLELDTNTNRDGITLSADRRTLTIDYAGVGNSADQMRILVPEPATAALLAAGGLMLMRRRRPRHFAAAPAID